MKASTSGFGRLTSAWNPAWPTTLTAAHDRPGAGFTLAAVRGEPLPNRELGPRVLFMLPWVESDTRPVPASRAELPARRGGLYRIALAQGASARELAGAIAAHEPRILVLDAALAERVGLEELRLLRRRHAAVKWMIGWDQRAGQWAELVLGLEMAGCIEWRLGTDDLTRALDAVDAGELWFPRWVMQWLYLSVLDAARVEATPGYNRRAGSAAAGHEPLTGREREVLALMREGLTNQAIADRMGISINTVKKHLAHAFEKRGLHTRRQGL